MIELKNIDVVFNQGSPLEKTIFKDLNLIINAQEFISLVGNNGAGKSTLVGLLSGEILPTRGEIQLNGKRITTLSELERAPLIAKVAQNPLKGTYSELSVMENLMIGACRGNFKPFQFNLKRKVLQKLDNMNLRLPFQIKEYLDYPMSQLSGGQRQVISLLMAVLAESEILLLDEFTSDLDPQAAKQILVLTSKIIKELNLSVLMITHSLDDALKYGNRLIFLQQGGIKLDVLSGDKEQLSLASLYEYYAYA